MHLLHFSIILGKLLAAVLVFLIAISETLIIAAVISTIAAPEWPVIIGHFIGLFLLGITLISIGMLISALTENQIIAAIGGFCVSIFLMLIDTLAPVINNKYLYKIVTNMSFRTRYVPFTLGIINFSNIIFFLSITGLFTFLTMVVFEKEDGFKMVTCMKKLINKKTGLKGIFILIILLCLVAVVLINVIATVLDSRYNLSIDLTKNHLFELDKATIEYISSLEKPVHIQMLAKEETFVEVSTYNAQANEILRQFEKNSKAITLSYVDYIKDPTFPSKYPDLKMKHGDILVSSGEAHRLIETESLFNYTTTATGQIAIASSKAEETICAAILNVTSDETIKVSVLTGHAEYTMPSFVKLLENNNYELVLQNLITEDINPEAKLHC